MFTAAVAFIDGILDPDKTLLVGYGFTDSPPIALPEEDASVEEALSTHVAGTVEQKAVADKPHAFKFDANIARWVLRFPGDPDCTFGHLKGIRIYQRLLIDRDKKISALELVGSPAASTLLKAKRTPKFTGTTKKSLRNAAMNCLRRSRPLSKRSKTRRRMS